jgi:hypothetical protein
MSKSGSHVKVRKKKRKVVSWADPICHCCQPVLELIFCSELSEFISFRPRLLPPPPPPVLAAWHRDAGLLR